MSAIPNYRQFRESLQRLVRGDLSAPLLRTMLARGAGAVGTFAWLVVLGRLYGASGVGVFALAESLLIAACTAARLGMDGALMRFVGRNVASSKAKSFLRHACERACMLSLLGTGLILGLRHVFGEFFHTPGLDTVLVGFGIATPAYTLSFIFSGYLASVRRPAASCLLQTGAIALLGCPLLIAAYALFPRYGLVNIGIAYAVASWAIAGGGAFVSWRSANAIQVVSEPLSKHDRREFSRSSSAFFATALAGFMISVVGVWIAGYMLSTSDVGLYKAAAQVAMLIGTIMTVMNVILPPRFATLYHSRSYSQLERLARRGALFGLALAAGPLLVCLLLPHFVLGFLGHDFAGSAILLQVLAVAQLINVGCGSVGHLLNMAGREVLSRNIAWASNIIALIILIALTGRFGALGVAVGVGSSLVIRKIFGAYYVWVRLGIWVVPGPNIARLIGIDAEVAS